MFEQVIPILRIFDESKAREFYLDYLGFKIDFEHRFDPNAPLYMGISRDGITLHLSEHYGDGTPGTTIFVRMKRIRDYHAELTAKNYKYYHPGVEDLGFGFDMMIIKDPFGNAIRFAEPIE
jgi:hypothetical protein